MSPRKPPARRQPAPMAQVARAATRASLFREGMTISRGLLAVGSLLFAMVMGVAMGQRPDKVSTTSIVEAVRPEDFAVEPVPSLEWTTDASVFAPSMLASAYRGALPNPGPNQKRSGECEEDVEVEINGGCWLATDKVPPCPAKKGGWVFYAHEGKCWVPVAKAARMPSSGTPHPVSIADP
jgi:hypothetical protein